MARREVTAEEINARVDAILTGRNWTEAAQRLSVPMTTLRAWAMRNPQLVPKDAIERLRRHAATAPTPRGRTAFVAQTRAVHAALAEIAEELRALEKRREDLMTARRSLEALSTAVN